MQEQIMEAPVPRVVIDAIEATRTARFHFAGRDLVSIELVDPHGNTEKWRIDPIDALRDIKRDDAQALAEIMVQNPNVDPHFVLEVTRHYGTNLDDVRTALTGYLGDFESPEAFAVYLARAERIPEAWVKGLDMRRVGNKRLAADHDCVEIGQRLHVWEV